MQDNYKAFQNRKPDISKGTNLQPQQQDKYKNVRHFALFLLACLTIYFFVDGISTFISFRNTIDGYKQPYKRVGSMIFIPASEMNLIAGGYNEQGVPVLSDEVPTINFQPIEDEKVTENKPVPKKPKKEAPKALKRKSQTVISIEDEQALKYINRFKKTAKQEQEKYNIPASIKLAQGLLESGKGTSLLATRNNNHFGIKCFEKKCPKGHCTNHSDDSHKDFFRKYDTAWESYRAHSKLLQKGIYKDCYKCGNDYECWAHALKKAGYATDPNYPSKLINMIVKYKLDALDTNDADNVIFKPL